MNNNRFFGKGILTLLSRITGLSSRGDKTPTNEIHYTTADNSVLTIKKLSYFGKGQIVSNKNVCILKFDKDVTEIGGDAFWGCSSLTRISIPPSVTKIGKDAFRNCSSLTSITIPPSVTEIGSCAFYGCKSLTSITIPPSVTEIGNRAFAWCSSLTNISVSKDNKVYDSREDCNAIIHTESNTLISGCENTIIPPSVTKIGDAAFSGCKSLTRISIPPSVTEIREWTFSHCSSLTEVRIPKGCYVHGSAFWNCPKVKIIRY